MKKVHVLIPFRVGRKTYKEGDVVELTEDKIKYFLSINCNMLIVLPEEEKPLEEPEEG